jgi:NAD(P)-dependent dehydrogenase (short-subunit alcohol dehydrogenase family)
MKEASNPLSLASFNAVVVGDGAIGGALAENLLQRPRLGSLLVLHRSGQPVVSDPRAHCIRFDALEPDSIEQAAASAAQQCERIHLLINTVGMLHSPEQQPEKRLADVDVAALQRAFALNAAPLPLLARAFSGLLRHSEPALLASLSARVGSLEDNGLGGWYSYRASKAAHNMLLLNLAREWRVSHRNVTLLALHPGTVRSRLSEPFLGPSYPNRILEPGESAAALLAVMASCEAADSGSFLDWRGERIPW